MRNTKRVRDRWFTAVAMTCLSGFALCGCTRGTRDLSSNLTDSAGRDAIEAERHVAERKRQETGGSKSKELLASEEQSDSPRRKPSVAEPIAESDPWDGEGEAIAARPSPKTAKGRASLDDSDLDTADWAGADLDRQVKTVSEEQEEGIDTAEPLLDSPARGPIAAELFEEDEGSVRVQQPDAQYDSTEAATPVKKSVPRPGKASFDGTSEHPWADKAPKVARSTPVNRPVASQSLADDQATSKPVAQPPRVKAPSKPKPSAAERTQLDEARMAEAKARVQTLLTQAKSLLQKGEYQSAYRVAQLAQRIADSENLFFVRGEAQPADIVRSVLMKIQSEESQVADAAETTRNEPSIRPKPASGTTAVQIRPGVNLPEGWTTPEWQNGEGRLAEVPDREESITASPSKPEMRIEPGPASRGSMFKPKFPNTRPEWRNTANEPLALSSSTEVVPPGRSTAKDGRLSSKVVQADMDTSPLADRQTEATSGSPAHVIVPRPFHAKPRASEEFPKSESLDQPASEPLAVAQDWRTQDLNNVATNRMPLLMAPLPPEEELIPETLGEAVDDSFATEIQEPSTPQSESKLWMILAAAAGAFAMLFVRRRPAAVVRTVSDGK